MLLFCWGSYCWACNLLVLIIYLFFLPIMLPSGLPRLATDSAGRVFPRVWKPLFLKFPSRDRLPFLGWASLPRTELPPHLLCLLFRLLYFFLPVFEDNGLLFWLPDVLCQPSEVVLWSLLALKCSFEEFVREKVVFLSYSSAILGPPPKMNILNYFKYF